MAGVCDWCTQRSHQHPESATVATLVGLPAGFGGADCLQCAPGSFSTGGFTQACQSCGVGQTSPAGAPGSDFCVCPAGQGNLGAGTCSTCPPGSYSSGPASLAQAVEEAQQAVRTTPVVLALPGCTNCPSGRTAPAGATSVNQCGALGRRFAFAFLLNGPSRACFLRRVLLPMRLRVLVASCARLIAV